MTRFSKSCLTCCTTVLLLLLSGQGLSFTSTALAFQTQTASRSDSKAGYRTTRKKTSRMSIESIRSALKRNPDDALLYYRAGFLEEQKGDLFQALRDYQAAIKLKARVAESYFRMGVIWEKTGELYDLKGTSKGRVVSGPHRRRAIDAYRAAIRSRSDFNDALYRLTLVYLIGDDMREANEVYQKLQKIEPDSERTKHLLLIIYKRHQQQMAGITH